MEAKIQTPCLGVSYYPEHRNDPAEIDHELNQIAEAGFSVVRLGEFAWCRFEPAEGRFDFTWLDTVVAKLWARGIQSIICTPTACPPAWLMDRLPDMTYIDHRGRPRPFGGRRHYCYNHPGYREFSRVIAHQLGKHYSGMPGVMGFQIDNELAQEGTGRCHCPVCAGKFRVWLRERHGDIGTLNQRWGTVFWGQEYQDFGQIRLPATSIEPDTVSDMPAYFDNPSLRLEFEIFASGSLTEYQDIQTDALRQTGATLVTTNATGVATNSMDYYQSFRSQDRYGFDLYPSLRHGCIDPFAYAHARSIKRQPFWVLEFTSGGGHRLRGSGRLQPFPGALRLAAMQAFFHGCELLAFFQFRSFLAGAEQLNYAILDTDGVPRRRYREVQRLATDLQGLSGFLNQTTIRNEVALVFDYRSLWAHLIKPVNTDFDYLKWCQEIHGAFRSLGIGLDIVAPDADLSPYRMVVLPAAIVMETSLQSRLETFVATGGLLLATFLSSVKNGFNVATGNSLPDGMTKLFGMVVSEVEPVFPDTVINLTIDGKQLGQNRYWLEVLEADGAELVGRYDGSFRSGQGAISRHDFGRGSAWYLGTGLSGSELRNLVSRVAGHLGRVPFEIPSDVDVVVREQGRKDSYCVMNFRETPVTIRPGIRLRPLGTDNGEREEYVIPPKDHIVLEASI